MAVQTSGNMTGLIYLLELTANYAKRLGDHNLNALVGYSFQRFTSKYLNAGNQGFLTDAFLFNNLGAGTYEKPGVWFLRF